MNEITIPGQALKAALPGFSKIIGRRSTLPVLSHLRITQGVTGVTMAATDLDSHAIYHVPDSLPGTLLDLLVPFEPLNKLLKGLGNQGAVTFSQPSPNHVSLRYGLGGSVMEQKLETLPAQEFPPLPRITKPAVEMGAGFGPGLKQALECCGDDPGRPVLRGAYLDVTDKKLHYIVGTNGRILFSANSFVFGLQESVIIPDSKFLGWTDLMDGGCALTIEPAAKTTDQGFIQLKSDRWTFIVKQVDGNFPNWRQCVPSLTSSALVIKLSQSSVKQLQDVIPHLPSLESDANHTIRLAYGAGQFKVEGRGETGDWTGAIVQDAMITGGPVSVGLNREYLLTALKFGLTEIQIQDAFSPFICLSQGKRMVIMPVNLNGPTPLPEPAKPEAAKPTPGQAPELERKPAMTTPQPKPNPPTPASLMDQVETIKETLKTAFRDLSALVEAVKLAEREKRATEKEVEAARATLKKLQQVTL